MMDIDKLNCEFCESTFTKKSSYKRHLKNIHEKSDTEFDQLLKPEQSKISCHLCDYQVTNRNKLILHLNALHDNNIAIFKEKFDSKDGKNTN
jgi:hypothetical protein